MDVLQIVTGVKDLDREIVRIWQDYISTISKKEETIKKLPSLFEERKKQLEELSNLLKLELLDVLNEETEEKYLIISIRNLEHDAKLQRTEELKEYLENLNKKARFIFTSLMHLLEILRSELEIVEKLKTTQDLKKYKKSFGILKSELDVETRLFNAINDNVTNMDRFLIDLANGKEFIKVDPANKENNEEIRVTMRKIFQGKINNGMLYDVTRRVGQAIWYKVGNTMENKPKIKPDGFIGQFVKSDYKYLNNSHEYVNRDEFYTLVRQIIKLQKVENIFQESDIHAFVQAFRECYNHQTY